MTKVLSGCCQNVLKLLSSCPFQQAAIRHHQYQHQSQKFLFLKREIRMTLTTIELDVQESAHRVIWAALHQLEYVASIIIIVITTAIINM